MEMISQVVLGITISVASIALVVAAINTYQMMMISIKAYDNNQYTINLRKNEE